MTTPQICRARQDKIKIHTHTPFLQLREKYHLLLFLITLAAAKVNERKNSRLLFLDPGILASYPAVARDPTRWSRSTNHNRARDRITRKGLNVYARFGAVRGERMWSKRTQRTRRRGAPRGVGPCCESIEVRRERE